jgi:signal transduction histidine kinase
LIDIIKEETARLNGLVGSFLEFARPRAPLVEPSFVNDLIDSTAALLENKAKRSRVRISTSLDGSLPPVDLDPDQIRQVLLNVMLNGIQAMPDGGALRIRSRNDRATGIVAIEISDTGPGLEEPDLDHVFDPFFTTKPQGTGLGLSISFQLVENHGGRILARPNPDRGLTFRIELPVGGVSRPASSPRILSASATAS